jgi:signal transduction histidine kinase
VNADVPNSTQTVVYRIVNELLGNALKHAEATEINLELVEENGILQIIVEDNGKGFPDTNNKQGLGLKNIEYRVMYLKGTCNIDSNSEGTTIIVGIPIK